MDSIPKDRILDIAPDSMDYIRKEYNLDGPQRMKDAVDILRQWVEKQEHFEKKDFDTFYLETTIFGCKGSIERAKSRLDRICTMRTIMPQFFEMTDLRKQTEKMSLVCLPKHTEDHYRVCLIKLHPGDYTSMDIRNFFKLGIAMAEYEKVHDYVNGFIVIMDFMDLNLLDLLGSINVLELKQLISILLEGYGMRVRAVHLVTDSKLVESLITVAKQVLNAKIANRVCVNKSVDELQKVISRKILPKDYGGEEKSIQELKQEWLEVLFSEDHLDHLKEMNNARTDESRRRSDQFNEHYAGMAGTFKLLNID